MNLAISLIVAIIRLLHHYRIKGGASEAYDYEYFKENFGIEHMLIITTRRFKIIMIAFYDV